MQARCDWRGLARIANSSNRPVRWRWTETAIRAKAPKGMRGISNNLSYISRDGKLDIEDQDGQVIQGKEAVADLKAEWQDGGVPIPQ